mgnify:CR=1 FL=1
MASSKEEKARMLDPQRFQVAKSMAVVPGGPMNNNPMNIGNIEPNGGSMSGMNMYPYGDSGLEGARQMGTNAVFPMQPSGLPQQNAIGRGYNSVAPYNQQAQPPSQAQDMMETTRLGGEAKERGLSPSPMGMIGLPAQPAPGGSVPSNEQSPGTLGLQGQMTAEVPPKGMNTRSGKRS